jgi:lysophospholipase L1-like esterase
MVMVGTNDLLNGNLEFINTLKKIFVQLSHDFPTAEILVNSLFPMQLPGMADYTIANLNCHIEAFTMQTGCCFLDSYRRVSDSDQPIFQEDGVHLTEAAYEIWTRALLEHIAFLIEND